ncbi:hypothetical protein GGR57DRAFT_508825 [Xylariaceae sp. FL1272]|nr:hypothetical protein GGR57DRAFT_508825 [Xylariaceae sp. FL1272]
MISSARKYTLLETWDEIRKFNWFDFPVETHGISLTSEDERNYFHAFNNECRAYWRLKEFGQEHLAIECHGYLNMEGLNFEYFMDHYRNVKRWGKYWEEPSEELLHKEKCFKAIVKELVDIPEDVDLLDACMNPKISREAIRDLKTIHRLGICKLDINLDNYMFGKYLDFSFAMTAPHPFLTGKYGRNFKPLYELDDDRHAIDDLIADFNEYHPREQKIWDVCVESLYYKRLRDRDRDEEFLPPRHHPVSSDYKKVRKAFGKKQAKTEGKTGTKKEGKKGKKRKS